MPAEPPSLGGFVGPQGPLLVQAVLAGENCLLAGPTGTGKTFLTEIVALQNEYELVVIKGMEGMLDLDIIGAILPQEDGTAPGGMLRKWVDGPLLRAMRAAQTDPVILFVDEVNRIPREQINLFIGMMNPTPEFWPMLAASRARTLQVMPTRFPWRSIAGPPTLP